MDGMKEVIRNILSNMGEDARVRINTRTGWASYTLKDLEIAWQLYSQEGTDILVCKNLFDEGKKLLGVSANA